MRDDTNIVSPCFLYLYLRNDSTKKKMEQSSFGSIFKGIRISVINDMEIALPSLCVLKKFDEIIAPILKQQNIVDEKVQALKIIKSQILPLLMNGQAVVR